MSLKGSQKKFNSINYVEVVGMPASGKSTLIKEIYAAKEKVYDVNGNLPKNKIIRLSLRIAYSLLAILHSPKDMIHDINIIASSKQKSKKDLVIVTLNWLYITYICNYIKPKEDTLYVWDQGFFQAIWSIVFSSQENIEFIRLLKNKNLPEKIYVTDADDDTLLKRSIARKVSIRLDYRNKNQILQARRALKKVQRLIELCGYSNGGFVYKKEG